MAIQTPIHPSSYPSIQVTSTDHHASEGVVHTLETVKYDDASYDSYHKQSDQYDHDFGLAYCWTKSYLSSGK